MKKCGVELPAQEKDCRYVSPEGSSCGNGTVEAPWSLQYALTGVNPQSFKELRLLSGTYNGSFSLSAASFAGLTVRSAPGHWARINSTSISDAAVVAVGCGFVTLRDVSLTCSDPQRTFASINNAKRPTGVILDGDGSKVINCLVYDTGIGIANQALGANTLIYGNVITNTGFKAPDRGHGHSMYLQNLTPTTKRIENNMMGPGYGWGIHTYTTNTQTNNLAFTGNSVCLSGVYSGTLRPTVLVGEQPTFGHHYDRHYSFGSIQMNYGNKPSTGLSVFNSRQDTNGAAVDQSFFGSSSNWSERSFYNNAINTTDTKAYVEANVFERGRYHITVFNPTNAASVTTTCGYAAGEKWWLYNTLDPMAAPIASGVGPTVTIPMAGLNVKQALSATITVSHPGRFGQFVVRKTPTWIAL